MEKRKKQEWRTSSFDLDLDLIELYKENHVLIYFRRRVSGIIVNFLCVLNVVCRRNIVCITG